MPVDVGRVLSRYTQLEARASTYREHCQEIAEFLIPDMSVITRLGGVVGEKRNDRIFDSTGPEAHGLLTAAMQDSLTPSTLRWFGLKTRDKALNDVYEVQSWLEQAEERMLLAFGQSNFYAEQFSAYQARTAFGTSALLIEERDKPARGVPFGGLRFRALPLQEYVIEEAPDGMVDTLYRCFEFSARNVVQQWPGTASDATKSLAEQRPDDRVQIVHAVYPRMVDRPMRSTLGLPFASCYLERRASHLLQESGFHEFPYAVPRWSKLAGEVYGRGPGMMALPDLKTLNKADELTLEGWALAIRPPRVMLEDSIVGDIDLTPDGLTIESVPNGLRHLENTARFDVNAELTKERQDRIRRIFFWYQLQLQDNRAMTATEVERRWELQRKVLGPTIGRQEAEDLTPTVARVFGIMLRAGAFPPIPEELVNADLDIVFEGPLARSQKVKRVAGMEQVVAHVSAVAAVNPEMAQQELDNLDPDDAFRDLCDIAGLPPSYMRSKEEVAAIRQARVERMQKEQMMQGFMQAGQVAQGAAPLLKALQGGRGQEAAA